jgi:hypothetical protein
MRQILAVLAALVGLSVPTSFPLAFGGQRGAPPPPPSQAPVAPAQRAAPTGTGLILGRVIDAGTGRPIPGARVMMTGAAAAERVTSLAASGLISMMEMEMAMVGTGGPNAQRAIADADGRFVFRNLPKGAIPISASMPGYLPGASGRYRHDGPSRPVELEEGERRIDVVVRMWKYASISGVVLDEAGEPVVGVAVRALRRLTSGTGPRLQMGTTVYTDDRGHYRLSALTPGEYLVAVPSVITTVPASNVDEYVQAITAGNTSQLMQARSASNAPVPSPSGIRVGDYQIQLSPIRNLQFPPPDENGRLFVYRTTFHPSAQTSADAQLITLGSGDERQNVGIGLILTPTVFISGVASGPDGLMAGLGLRLVPADADQLQADNGFEAAHTATDGLGRFSLLGVPPGQYVLKALRTPVPAMAESVSRVMSVVDGVASISPMGPPPTAAPSGPTLWAELPISVGDRSVTDLHVVLREGARVSGRVEFTGAAAPPPPERLRLVSISMTPAEPGPLLRAQPGRLSEAGQFTTGGFPPGRYLMQANSPAPPWAVRSIMLNGRNVLEEPFDLGSTDLGGVVVTYTDRQTQLTFNVQGGQGTDRSDVLVVAFPADYQKWIQDGMVARRARTAPASRTGVATMVGLSPGDYLVAAVTAESPVDLRSVQSIEMLARQATRVTLAEGETRTQMLTVSTVR